MFDSMSRREAIKAAMGAGLAAAAGAGLAGCSSGQSQGAASPERDASTGKASNGRRSCRIAHLTDMHIQPEKNANVGVSAALAHVQGLKDRPAMIVTGGDTVMDSFDRDRARTALQWDLWKQSTSSCRIPMRSVLGNHDIWGWNKSKSGTSGNEPGWGKALGVEMLAMPARFYAFDLPRESGSRVGWRCLMLDTVQPEGESGYTAFVDPEQMEWLKSELAAANRPGGPYLFVVTHIPILSATVFIQKKAGRRTDVTGGLMHTDAQELKDLFATCPNVRACVSGHLHLLDHVSYNGVEYFCNGAVSGGWWGGKNIDCDAGYAVMDLYDDGRVVREYVNYGWVART